MPDIIPYISRLFVYPVKALDRVSVERVTILRSGALKRDREFAIFDASGQFVNGKRNARVHALRSQFDLVTNTVSLSLSETDCEVMFHIEKEREALESCLS